MENKDHLALLTKHGLGLQVDAAGSLAAGDISYDNVHKAIFGYNQNKNRHLLSGEVKVRQKSSLARLPAR